MMREALCEGSDVEEALAKAKAALGLTDTDDYDFEVVQREEKKKFGLFGGKPAKVRVFIEEVEKVVEQAKPVAAEKPARPAKPERPAKGCLRHSRFCRPQPSMRCPKHRHRLYPGRPGTTVPPGARQRLPGDLFFRPGHRLLPAELSPGTAGTVAMVPAAAGSGKCFPSVAPPAEQPAERIRFLQLRQDGLL